MDIDELPQFAAVETGQAGGHEAARARRLHRAQDVGRIAADAKADGEVAAFGERNERLGKDGFIPHIVGIGRESRHVVVEGDHLKARAVRGDRPFAQVAGKVRGGGGAAPISKEKHPATLCACTFQVCQQRIEPIEGEGREQFTLGRKVLLPMAQS